MEKKIVCLDERSVAPESFWSLEQDAQAQVSWSVWNNETSKLHWMVKISALQKAAQKSSSLVLWDRCISMLTGQTSNTSQGFDLCNRNVKITGKRDPHHLGAFMFHYTEKLHVQWGRKPKMYNMQSAQQRSVTKNFFCKDPVENTPCLSPFLCVYSEKRKFSGWETDAGKTEPCSTLQTKPQNPGWLSELKNTTGTWEASLVLIISTPHPFRFILPWNSWTAEWCSVRRHCKEEGNPSLY